MPSNWARDLILYYIILKNKTWNVVVSGKCTQFSNEFVNFSKFCKNAMAVTSILFLFKMQTYFQQESITVGCVPPASVVITRCHFCGGRTEGGYNQYTCPLPLVYPPPWYTCSLSISLVYSLPGIPTPLVYLPHGITNHGIPTPIYLPPWYTPWYTNLSPGIPTPRRDLGPGIPIPCGQTHDLRSRAVKILKRGKVSKFLSLEIIHHHN